MVDIFESGITVTYVCALCGKRYAYAASESSAVHLHGDWTTVKISDEARHGHLYSAGHTTVMLFCCKEHGVAYMLLERQAIEAAQEAFRSHIRDGQAKARSAVDALASVKDDDEPTAD